MSELTYIEQLEDENTALKEQLANKCKTCPDWGMSLTVQGLEEQLAKYEQDTLSLEDYEQVIDSIKNPKYNEKLANALKRPLPFEKETTCPDCIKLEKQLAEAVKVIEDEVKDRCNMCADHFGTKCSDSIACASNKELENTQHTLKRFLQSLKGGEE